MSVANSSNFMESGLVPNLPAGGGSAASVSGGPGLAVIPSSDGAAWRKLVEVARESDAGHLPDLWQHAEARGDGAAFLFVHREGEDFIALPLLLRPLRGVPGLEASDGFDAVSVGDYAGPMASRRGLPDGLIRGFQERLAAELRGRGVVAAFSKLNPLLAQEPLLAGLGSTEYAQTTVAIDLTLTPDEQFRRYRPRLRSYLRSGSDDNLEPCLLDYDEHLPQFLGIYEETMDRVGAAPVFRYPISFYASLRSALGDRFHMFGMRHDGRLVAAYLGTEWNGILQGIISCVRTEALHQSPARVMYDYIRRWATERGCRVFHLGGGTSPAPDNPLFLFKAGFSDRRHEFRTWRWVVDSAPYGEACRRKAKWNRQQGFHPVRSDFFPEYRTPANSPDEAPPSP
jgi:CelD/BcsL family acetyltransferase involved in cellulose biosynthesis